MARASTIRTRLETVGHPGMLGGPDDVRRGEADAGQRVLGLDQEVDALRQEIACLRTLGSEAASDLKAAGQDRKAARLLRALEGL